MQMMPLVNHVNIRVKDFVKSKNFYGELMELLGASVSWDKPNWCLWGNHNFGIIQAKPGAEVGYCHVAFNAKSCEQVQAFYEKALAMGATDNGKPGIRMEFYDGYYAAYMYDLDGHNIEVVHYTHGFKDSKRK
ncbi:Glyoxalase/Bleomycin resistance protein/Dihydroxybiphenyl dioxygenase [Umbelopsis sp. PMI_123]|nr:Glyoxalase/Bleomycin resistance protein/Dihydroxybiphenyl dioxygenase [Umbelopsis sp. PMI_123]